MPDPFLSVDAEGCDRVIAKLGRAEGLQVLRAPVEETVTTWQTDMKVYPPPRRMVLTTRHRGGAVKAVGMRGSNKRQAYWVSSYRRTGTLGRRWTKRVRNVVDGVVGVVGNNTIYAPLVQSYTFQSGVHRGRWQTDRDVIRRNAARVRGYFRAAIERALR